MKYVMHVVLVLLLVQGTLAAKEETGKTERTRGGMAFLGKNVRLDFRMVPDEPDDEPLFLITAVSKFRAHASFENDEGEFSFRVGGQIDVTEEGLLLVVYEAEMSMHGMAGGRACLPVCVCACVHACLPACVWVCASARACAACARVDRCERAWVCARVHACMHT